MEINGFMKALMAVIIAVIMVVLVAVPILTGFTETGPGETAENENLIPDTRWKIGYISPGMQLEVVYDTTTGADQDLFTINGYPAQIVRNENTDMAWFVFENGGMIAVKDGDIGVRNTGSNPLYWGYDKLVITGGRVYVDSSEKEFSDLRGVLNATCDAFNGMQLYGLMNNDKEFYVNDGVVCYNNSIKYSAVAAEGEVTMTEIGGSGTLAPPITFTSEGNYLSATWANIVFVPVEYYTTPSTPAQVSGPVADLIDVVPLIMVVGVVVATVGVFLVRYRT